MRGKKTKRETNNSKPNKEREREKSLVHTFPGEKKDYVEKIFSELLILKKSIQIFSYLHYQAELAKPNMDVDLQNIYDQQSQLTVVFLCEKYEEKEWCGLEWRVIKNLIKKQKYDQIMPFRFDNTEIDGFFGTDGYINANKYEPKEAAELILQRFKMLKKQPPSK